MQAVITCGKGMTALGIVIQPPKGAVNGVEIPPRALGEIPTLMHDDSLIDGGSMKRGVLYADPAKGMRIGPDIFYGRALANGFLFFVRGNHASSLRGDQMNTLVELNKIWGMKFHALFRLFCILFRQQELPSH